MSSPVPLVYTFGNHMHWVDMQWLWGYHVLPGSVRDMLTFCRETGARGNINFDGIGYEKLASENPEAFAELRDAVRNGTVELVGCSYGQPYGLFHGGESNVRQRVYGARAALRLFGVRPRTFWEEEFDFFPQLPQMLAGAGFEHASLFFQWTWHTPEVPKEEVPVVLWEGQDGTRLTCATRNRLNLHQWPEDVAILMDELAETGVQAKGPVPPLILQWLELMPSPDWMCRSEVLLPKTKELLGDPRFEIRFATLGEYLDGAKGTELPVRRYTMDQVWHGMSLGKNGDAHPRSSHHAERCLLAAESFASMLGLFGRPYAQWDVYPTWELEEGWRNLLAAQHHDNHECEGLCGHVAETQFQTAQMLSESGHRGLEHLASRVSRPAGAALVANPFGWTRRVALSRYDDVAIVDVPPFGYRTVTAEEFVPTTKKWQRDGNRLTFTRERFDVAIDLERALITLVRGGRVTEFPLPFVRWTSNGLDRLADEVDVESRLTSIDPVGDEVFLIMKESDVAYWISVPKTLDAIDLTVSFEPMDPLSPGMNASAQTIWRLPAELTALTVDQPYGVSPVEPNGEWPRKYPTGDWMTSPQWFETVKNPFTSQSFVNVTDTEGNGVLVLHNGSQQWFRNEEGLQNVVAMFDPWDEAKASSEGRTRYRIFPHTGVSNAEAWRMSRELFGQLSDVHLPNEWAESDKDADAVEGDLPPEFSVLSVDAPNVAATAFYRETRDAGAMTPGYAAAEFEADYPYVLRLVEFDGVETEATIRFAPTVASVAKTDLMGSRSPDQPALDSDRHTVRVRLRPFEIATLTLDLIEGRKQVRDLDAKREIWATVHRIES